MLYLYNYDLCLYILYLVVYIMRQGVLISGKLSFYSPLYSLFLCFLLGIAFIYIFVLLFWCLSVQQVLQVLNSSFLIINFYITVIMFYTQA